MDDAPPLPPIRGLAAGRGAEWWRVGWHMFKGAPGTWIAICVAFVLIPFALQAAGAIAQAASTFLAPILSAGVFIAARAQDDGAGPRFEQLFAGFGAPYLKPLAVLGVTNVVLSYVLLALVAAAVTALVGPAGLEAFNATDTLDLSSIDLTVLVLTVLVATPFLLVGGFLILMAFWYAPGLVIANGVGPLAALGLSFRASLRNFGAALVYSLLGLVYTILASLPLGLGWFVLGPVMAGSWYAMWRDVFGDGAREP